MIFNVFVALLVSGPRTLTPSFAATPARLQLGETAESTTRTASAQSAQEHSVATGTAMSTVAALTRVLRAEPTGEVEAVYNLTVADCHEYLANGILVSNCDAARYSYEALTHYLSKLQPDPADAKTSAAYAEEAERIEKRMDTREQVRAARLADGDEAFMDSIAEEY